MSVHKDIKRVTTHVLQEMKRNNEKISMLTSYDYSIAKIVDEAGIDAVLVGDSVKCNGGSRNHFTNNIRSNDLSCCFGY